MSDRPDIEDVLDHYGVTGRGRMVSCPLHPDGTPSCSINYGSSLWKCHSCGEGGDSWSLVMKKEDLNFPEAAEWAEKNLGFKGDGARASGPMGSAYGGQREGRQSSSKAYRPSWRK